MDSSIKKNIELHAEYVLEEKENNSVFITIRLGR